MMQLSCKGLYTQYGPWRVDHGVCRMFAENHRNGRRAAMIRLYDCGKHVWAGRGVCEGVSATKSAATNGDAEHSEGQMRNVPTRSGPGPLVPQSHSRALSAERASQSCVFNLLAQLSP